MNPEKSAQFAAAWRNPPPIDADGNSSPESWNRFLALVGQLRRDVVPDRNREPCAAAEEQMEEEEEGPEMTEEETPRIECEGSPDSDMFQHPIYDAPRVGKDGRRMWSPCPTGCSLPR
jgi:hypothetical protein